MNNISVVMCRYADAFSQYLQSNTSVVSGSVSLSTLISDGYLPSVPDGVDMLGGWYEVKMYADNDRNGVIALYGDEHYSLTVESIKQFLGIRGASISGAEIVSAGGYYSLPIANFTGFSSDNLMGLMLIPAIQTSGQNCDRGGYVF